MSLAYDISLRDNHFFLPPLHHGLVLSIFELPINGFLSMYSFIPVVYSTLCLNSSMLFCLAVVFYCYVEIHYTNILHFICLFYC